jgi:hypothetical protein
MSTVSLERKHLPKQTESVVADRKKSMHDSDALDEALIESFPASDPVAVSVTRVDVGAVPGSAHPLVPRRTL